MTNYLLSPMDHELRERVKTACTYVGVHPNCVDDVWYGWLMMFEFPNGLIATVVYSTISQGLEVGVRRGDYLVEVHVNLNVDEVFERLIEIMERPQPPSAFGHFPQIEEHDLGEERPDLGEEKTEVDDV